MPAHGRAVVKTGLQIAIPAGTYARVAPRSGLAVKHFIDTGAGVVDEDYRGEVGVVLFNHADTPFQGEARCCLAALLRQVAMPARLRASAGCRRLSVRLVPPSRLPAHPSRCLCTLCSIPWPLPLQSSAATASPS